MELLPTLKAESVHAIVTDPPYGLSQNRFYGSTSIFKKIGFPKNKNGYSQMLADFDFFVPSLHSSFLGGVDCPIREEPRVGMPESSINFKEPPVIQHEVNDSSKSTIPPSDKNLSGVRDTEFIENNSYFVLKLGREDIGSISDIPTTSGAYLFSGGFACSVSISFSTSSHRLFGSEGSSLSSHLGDINNIRSFANSGSETKGSPSILAGGRTIRMAMLRFDLRGRPIELDFTDRTSQIYASSLVPCAELVRAVPRTSRLSPMLQSFRVRLISDTANGACSINLLLPAHNESSLTHKGFMGNEWDGCNSSGLQYFSYRWGAECLRVLKPGGILLAFGATRTYGRLQCGLEDAGFEIRDTIAWLYGTGFSKSTDISKTIDKLKGAKRKPLGKNPNSREKVGDSGFKIAKKQPITKPASEEAREWDGWGTALKPAMELIVVARKPISEKTIAENVLKHGTGAINIDACRIPVPEGDSVPEFEVTEDEVERTAYYLKGGSKRTGKKNTKGRFPANVALDGSKEVLERFPEAKAGGDVATRTGKAQGVAYSDFGDTPEWTSYGDAGSAGRFFYCSKASRAEREKGLEHMGTKKFGMSSGARGAIDREEDYEQSQGIGLNQVRDRKNHHSTVKPVDLMAWLLRLVVPKGGIVLDPFMGSGTTGVAACIEEVDFIGIEQDEEYMEIAKARIEHENNKATQLNLF